MIAILYRRFTISAWPDQLYNWVENERGAKAVAASPRAWLRSHLCLSVHRVRLLSAQKVGGQVPPGPPAPARLARLGRLGLHRLLLLLRPLLLPLLLQRLGLPRPPLPLPLLLLGAPAELVRPRGPAGRGRRGPERRQDPAQAPAEPQLAARSLRGPPEGVGLRLGAAAAGSVRQQRVHGVKERTRKECQPDILHGMWVGTHPHPPQSGQSRLL